MKNVEQSSDPRYEYTMPPPRWEWSFRVHLSVWALPLAVVIGKASATVHLLCFQVSVWKETDNNVKVVSFASPQQPTEYTYWDPDRE